MNRTAIDSFTELYELDETAWLEQMAQLIGERRFAELDYRNLGEFLTDMARRDKREVLSRLVVLMTHRLKWEHQVDDRSNSWRLTLAEQRRELEELLASGTLRNYAREALAKAYAHAVEQATMETGLAASTFAPQSEWSLDDWLSKESADDEAQSEG